MRCSLHLPLLLCCSIALAGCASKPYASAAPKNLTILAEVNSGHAFGTRRGTQVGVYRLANKCPLEFLGPSTWEQSRFKLALRPGTRPI